jgi:predicted NodU family carbamoyl transferase
MIILGISIGVDRGSVLMQNGTPIIGIHESKLSRVYRDGAFQNTLPKLSIDYCFDNSELTIDDVDLVVFTSKDGGYELINEISEVLGIDESKIEFVPNQIAMSFALYSISNTNQTLVSGKGSIITPDSLVEKWYSENGYDVEFTSELHWRESTTFTQFKEDGYVELHKTWIDDADVFTNMSHMYSTASHRLVYDKLNYKFNTEDLSQLSTYSDGGWENLQPNVYTTNEGYHKEILPKINYTSDFKLRANLAGVYQREHLKVCTDLIGKFNEYPIVVGGALFKNSRTLSELYNVEVTNLIDDEALPLGCAVYGNFKLTSSIVKVDTLNIGKSLNIDDVIDGVDHINKIFKGNFSEKYALRVFNNNVELVDFVSKLILKNKLVGVVCDKHNLGINQMGIRSILTSPTNRIGLDHLTMHVKECDWWLKYHNIIIEDKLTDVLEYPKLTSGYPISSKIHSKWKDIAPSVINHKDEILYTTSNSDFVNKVCDRYHELSGVPFITSIPLSMALEPEVENVDDILRTLYNSKLSALCIENILIIKK